MTKGLALHRFARPSTGVRDWFGETTQWVEDEIPARGLREWHPEVAQAVYYADPNRWAAVHAAHPQGTIETVHAISAQASTLEVLDALAEVRSPGEAELFTVLADQVKEGIGTPAYAATTDRHHHGLWVESGPNTLLCDKATFYRYRNAEGAWATRAARPGAQLDSDAALFSSNPADAAYTIGTVSRWAWMSRLFAGGQLEAYRPLDAQQPLPDVLRDLGRGRTDRALFEGFATAAERWQNPGPERAQAPVVDIDIDV